MIKDFRSFYRETEGSFPSVVTCLELERLCQEVDDVSERLERIAVDYAAELGTTHVCRLLYCRLLFLTNETTLEVCVDTLQRALKAHQGSGVCTHAITVERLSPVDVPFIERLEGDVSTRGSFGAFQEQKSVRMVDGKLQPITYIYFYGEEAEAATFFHLKEAVALPVVAYVDREAAEVDLPNRIQTLKNFPSKGMRRDCGLLAFDERTDLIVGKWSLTQPRDSLVHSLREFHRLQG